MNLNHARHRRYDWDRGLSATGDHIDVGRIEMRIPVNNWDTVRTDGRRRQVDKSNVGLEVAQERIVLDMGTSARGIEDNVNIGEFG